jgi:hypothetical protein
MSKKGKKSSGEETSRERVATVSQFRPGGGSKRIKSRLITVYGPPKTRKTTAVSTLPIGRTKWLISDSNCIPTLRSLNRLPADEDIYEVSSLTEALELTGDMVKLAQESGHDALGIDFLVVDSLTQFSDWHQRKIAMETGQRFMGDAGNGTGWQQFNAEFGELLDNFALLSQLGVTVVTICHSKDKLARGKGEWAVFNLPPQMATKVGRLSNWILLKLFEEVVPEDEDNPPSGPLIEEVERAGKKWYFRNVLRTMPLDGWTASVNSLALDPDEPGDLAKLLEKDGLL